MLKVMISAFVSFLDSPHINSALRKLRREVFALEAFVLVRKALCSCCMVTLVMMSCVTLYVGPDTCR